MSLFAAVPDWIANWLTPLWLLGVGALLGLAVLAVLWLLVFLIARIPGARRLRRMVDEIPMTVTEGVLWPVLLLVGGLAAFGVVGYFVSQDPDELLANMARIPVARQGTTEREFTIPGTGGAGGAVQVTEVALDVDKQDLQQVTLISDQNLLVSPEPGTDVPIEALFELPAGEESGWVRGQTEGLLGERNQPTLYVRNLAPGEATLTVSVVRQLAHPQVWSVPIMALSVVGVFLLYLLQRTLMPKASAVALSTAKSEIAQPLFSIILIAGAVLLVLFIWFPYNTFGEDIKVLKDSGLTLIMVLGIVQAVWAASTSIAEEIDGRTALTVLSKPISRRSFIFGKFLGIVWTVALIFMVLGVFLLIVVAYKPIYDAAEGADIEPTWQLTYFEMIRTVPGLVLAFMETVVLGALSVAISTRLPMLANFVICFAIYVLGHITPLIVQSSVDFEIVKFIGRLIATVFPNLENFNIQAAVAGGTAVPVSYVGWALLYCLLYSVIAMLLALVLFEDRDLA